jgi:hypothetical protein
MTTPFDAFIDAAWHEHGERPQQVAERLAASLALVDTPARVAPYAQLLTHVYGEHLGAWQRGVQLLGALPTFDSTALPHAVARGIAVLRFGGGEADAVDALALEDRIAALSTAASALAAHDAVGRALTAYATALRDGEGLPAESAALRALAVGGNNLACLLESKRARTAEETRGMVAAAQAALRLWTQAGTWLERERAEYRLARSLLHAGDVAGAADAAQRCVDACACHHAPPFERFFAHAALADAQRAAGHTAGFETERAMAQRCFEQLPPAEREACAAELAALG